MQFPKLLDYIAWGTTTWLCNSKSTPKEKRSCVMFFHQWPCTFQSVYLCCCGQFYSEAGKQCPGVIKSHFMLVSQTMKRRLIYLLQNKWNSFWQLYGSTCMSLFSPHIPHCLTTSDSLSTGLFPNAVEVLHMSYSRFFLKTIKF